MSKLYMLLITPVNWSDTEFLVRFWRKYDHSPVYTCESFKDALKHIEYGVRETDGDLIVGFDKCPDLQKFRDILEYCEKHPSIKIYEYFPYHMIGKKSRPELRKIK